MYFVLESLYTESQDNTPQTGIKITEIERFS